MFNLDTKESFRADSFVKLGETYRILASSSVLRGQLTDSYWCSAMEEVCDGKLDGVAVRYTGQNLVFTQFMPNNLSPSGYRYPLSMSIPAEYLVPVSGRHHGENVSTSGSLHPVKDAADHSLAGSHYSMLCVVCGRYNVPGMLRRQHGYKCKECVGKKSKHGLRVQSRAGGEEGGSC